MHARADIPIYLAAIGPKNVALAAEIADGWLPVFFSPERAGVFHEALAEGFDAGGRAGKRARFDVAPMVPVVRGPRRGRLPRPGEAAARALRGGHGRARARTSTSSWPAATATRRRPPASRSSTSRAGRPEAEAAVPDALVDEVALCGPPERIRERLPEWRAAGVTTLVCATAQSEAVRVMAELVL